MKRSEQPLQKVTLNLFEGDMERLMAIYPRHGASFVIRNLVRQYVKNLEAKTEARKTGVVEFEFNLNQGD